MSYSKGLGATMGEGMGAFVQQFIGRQDQVRQLAQQEEQLKQQAIQRELENQRAAQQVELQRQQMGLQAQQYADGRSDTEYNRARTAGLDLKADAATARQDRHDQVKTFLGPQMNDFMAKRDADVAQYAPTTKDGRPNPQYNPSLFAAAQTQQKEANKLWQQIAKSVGTGEGWEDSTGKLLSFIGGEPLPSAPQAAPAPVAPAVMPAPTVAPALPQPGDRNMERGNAALGDAPAPVAAPMPAPPVSVSDSSALPPRVQDVPPSQLMSMDDATLTARYGQDGMRYVQAARVDYTAKLKAQQDAALKARQGVWETQYKELAKREDLTPDQRLAIFTIDKLMGQPELTPAEQTQLADAFTGLAPAMYTVASWQKVLDTKDPATILAQLPMYQKFAPNLVAGFDPSFFADLQGAALSKIDSEVAENLASADASKAAGVNSLASATKTGAETTELVELLPGKVAQQGATLNATNVGILDTQADTALTQAQTGGEYLDQQLDKNKDAREGNAAQLDAKTAQLKARQDAYELGIKTLGQWAKTGATTYQLIQSDPKGWAQMKRDLGVTDSGLTAMLQLGRFEYGRGLDKEDLENKLKASQVATDGARRAGIYATTAGTQANTGLTTARTATENATRDGRVLEIDTRVDLLNQQITESEGRGLNMASQIRERDALLNERSTLLTAQAAAARGSALASTATALATPQRVANDTTRAAATTVQAANGTAMVGVAQERVGLERDRIAVARDALQIDRTRAAAYVQSVKGNPVMDAAKIAEINARTALTRSKDPNDPLFNAQVAASKPGDPIDTLKKKAGVYYTQADQALKQANSLTTQINGITSKGKTISGAFNEEKLTPADRTKLAELVKQRDKLMAVAINRRATGDNIFLDGMKAPSITPPPLSNPKVAPGFSAAQQWAAQNVEIPGVISDCAAIAGKYLNQLGLKIPTSNLSAGLEVNAKKAGWTPTPVKNGLQEGDLIVWTGKPYGYQKDASKIGKHVGVVVLGPDGTPMILQNPGLQNDGTQGKTKIGPMFDPQNAVAYRSPQAANLGAPAATKTTPPPPAPTTLPRPDTRITGVGPPQGITPVGQVQGIAKRITRAAWVQAQGIESPQMAEAWLDRTVNGLMPKGTAQQKATMKTDLATTLGW